MRQWAALVVISLWLAAAATALAQGDGSGQTTIHVVQRGETLFRIALRYGTSIEAITQTNGLSDPTSIQVGQRLIIPSGTVNATIPTAGSHVVQPGETLAHIALRYGSTPSQVAALNSIVNPARLFVGQVLDVSEAAPGHLPVTHGYTHVVQADETLHRIALQYGATLQAVLRANDLSSPTLIFPGQRLLIPGPDTAPALQNLPAPLSALEIAPLPIEVGRSFRLRVVSQEPITPGGSFLERPLRFSAEPDGTTYDALFGVHAFTVPAIYPLTLTIQDAQGAVSTLAAQVRVVDGRYASEAITLPPGQDSLLDPTTNDAEYAQVAAVMSGYTPVRYFDGPLGLPAAAPVTSPFGIRRSYNGGPYDRFHTGVDFGSPPGAPIYAPAPGYVVFVDMLQIRGLTTILDHGWGVYTGYWHQSEAHVQPGQFVNAGDVIGAVGSTGRSTGAHLHWEMWVNGVEVDPLQWTRHPFP